MTSTQPCAKEASLSFESNQRMISCQSQLILVFSLNFPKMDSFTYYHESKPVFWNPILQMKSAQIKRRNIDVFAVWHLIMKVNTQ